VTAIQKVRKAIEENIRNSRKSARLSQETLAGLTAFILATESKR
jgi:hypothetical protein